MLGSPFRLVSAACLAAALVLGAPRASLSQPKPVEAVVATPRMKLGDLVPSVRPELATLDLGAAPAPGGSRVVTREELTAAIEATGKRAPKLPSAVRVVRKMKKLTPAELERITRASFGDSTLPRGATLAAVRSPGVVEVADGWDAVVAEVARPPKRTGRIPSAVTLTFSTGGAILARLSIPIELVLTEEAARFDVKKGASLTLVVVRGSVEVAVAGMAGADADVGSPLPVTVRASGRLVQARLVANDRAIALD